MEMSEHSSNRQAGMASHETLRLVIALYVMGAAIGLWDMPGSDRLTSLLFGPALGPSLYAIALFGAAWFVLVGLHLQAASLSLMALVLSGAALGGTAGTQEVLLTLALLPVAGAIRHKARKDSHQGRIRLTRIKAPRTAKRAPGCTAPADHPFSQSPDELDCLFDQIAEAS